MNETQDKEDTKPELCRVVYMRFAEYQWGKDGHRITTRHNLELGIMTQRMDAGAFVYAGFFLALKYIM